VACGPVRRIGATRGFVIKISIQCRGDSLDGMPAILKISIRLVSALSCDA
jgi:hypothetical protein